MNQNNVMFYKIWTFIIFEKFYNIWKCMDIVLP